MTLFCTFNLFPRNQNANEHLTPSLPPDSETVNSESLGEPEAELCLFASLLALCYDTCS